MSKRITTFLFTALIILLMTGISTASPITVEDKYWGANDNGKGDVIGDKIYFEISNAVVSLSGTLLVVDIYTAFAGRADDKLFTAYTKNGKGIGYGDLFLSSLWKPYGDEPYLKDNNVSGTIWSYGFALNDRWSTTGGDGKLYKLSGSTNDANALLTGDFMTGSAIWRDGQEVAVDVAAKAEFVTDGKWTVEKGFLRFYLDISDTGLLGGPEIAFHWGQTCGNDVIEGKVPVSEPATMLLLGMGFLGLAVFGRSNLFHRA